MHRNSLLFIPKTFNLDRRHITRITVHPCGTLGVSVIAEFNVPEGQLLAEMHGLILEQDVNRESLQQGGPRFALTKVEETKVHFHTHQMSWAPSYEFVAEFCARTVNKARDSRVKLNPPTVLMRRQLTDKKMQCFP